MIIKIMLIVFLVVGTLIALATLASFSQLPKTKKARRPACTLSIRVISL